MSKAVSRTLLVASACVLLGVSPNISSAQSTAGSPNDLPQFATGDNKTDANVTVSDVLQWARQEVEGLQKNVTDYSSTLVSRERVDGKLGQYETVFVKIRHQPFSVYAYILGPDSRKGNEAIFVEGKNDNQLLVHTTGVLGKLFGTLTLDPVGSMAMKDRRHPITELGMRDMCRGLIHLLESDRCQADCKVRILRGAKINQRPCTCIEIWHPVRREGCPFCRVRIFIDDKLKLPTRYERYDWPETPDGNPELVEEYTYVDIRLNNGFNDAEFDPRNPNYAFP